MTIRDVPDSLLLRQFREFYAEIVRLKAQLQTSEVFPTPEKPPASEPVNRQPSPQAIQQSLLSTLEQLSLEAMRHGGAFAYEVYREAQYVFAALADEVFLNLPWPGSQSWPLLESKLFQSHRAGELFFEKLDQLLARQDRAYQDLAAVFFQALALGFKGKYRGGHELALDRYRQRLFHMIYQQRPHLFEEGTSLFPQSYLYTLREGTRKMLPDPRRWLALVPVVLLIWLALSTLFWKRATSKIDQTLRKIEAAPTSLTREGR